MVAEYSGLNFYQVYDLDYPTFLAWRRDAFIFNCQKSESGREYLDHAWTLEQTKPDLPALRAKFGGKA